MGPGWIVSSNLEKDVNVIGNFVFEFNLITFTLGVHFILFSDLICNHLRADGTLCNWFEVKFWAGCNGALLASSPRKF